MNKQEVERLIRLVAARTAGMDMHLSRPQQHQWDWFEAWDWGPGVAYYGMISAYAATGNEEILTNVRKYVDSNYLRAVQRTINTTTPCLVALHLAKFTGTDSYNGLISEYADFVMIGAERAADGAVLHSGVGMKDINEIWVDTLFMAGVFLVHAGDALKRKDCVLEGFRQLTLHFERLQIPGGLLYHGYSYDSSDHMSACLWARGNAWALVSVGETIEILRQYVGSEELDRLIGYTQHLATALMDTQTSNGLWGTVLDLPSSYEELSASAGIVAGILKGVRFGYLPRELLKQAGKSFLSVAEHISEDGTVTDVSAGTGVQPDIESYLRVPKNYIMPWGQGLTLMMLGEYLNIQESGI